MAGTVKARVSVATSVASALAISTGQIVTSGTSLAIPYSFVSNSSSTGLDTSKISRSSLSLGGAYHQIWNAQTNIRFKELARKEMMGDLTAKEWAELESLASLRRQAKFPLSADQILWQRKQTALTEKLLAALKEYVVFHKYTES